MWEKFLPQLFLLFSFGFRLETYADETKKGDHSVSVMIRSIFLSYCLGFGGNQGIIKRIKSEMNFHFTLNSFFNSHDSPPLYLPNKTQN